MKNTDKNVSEIKLYTLEELTDMLNVTVYTLRNYVKSGKLKAAKIGGKWRVSEENLKKFVNGDGRAQKRQRCRISFIGNRQI